MQFILLTYNVFFYTSSIHFLLSWDLVINTIDKRLQSCAF